jgi:hypothetical protein
MSGRAVLERERYRRAQALCDRIDGAPENVRLWRAVRVPARPVEALKRELIVAVLNGCAEMDKCGRVSWEGPDGVVRVVEFVE